MPHDQRRSIPETKRKQMCNSAEKCVEGQLWQDLCQVSLEKL